MALPVSPLTLASPGLSVHVGDRGATWTFQLQETQDSESAYPLPDLSTVILRGAELPETPTKERRTPRAIGGACAIDGTDASQVTYTVSASDTAHAGSFIVTLIATFPTGEVITWPSGDGLPMEIV